MPTGIVQFPGASIPHIPSQTNSRSSVHHPNHHAHLDPMGSLTPPKNNNNDMMMHQQHQHFETDSITATKQLFSWSANNNDQQQSTNASVNVSITSKQHQQAPAVQQFEKFFPSAFSSSSANEQQQQPSTNHHHESSSSNNNNNEFGLGVTKDMLDQIKATRAQLNMLTQKQELSFQHFHQEEGNQQQQSSFQHLDKGKISSAWDLSSSPNEDFVYGGMTNNNNENDFSPTFGNNIPHQRGQGFSVSPLPSSSRNKNNNNNESSPSPYLLPEDANNNNNNHHNTSNNSSSVSPSKNKKRPWNYRAGQAEKNIKDADPAAAAVEVSALTTTGAIVELDETKTKARKKEIKRDNLLELNRVMKELN